MYIHHGNCGRETKQSFLIIKTHIHRINNVENKKNRITNIHITCIQTINPTGVKNQPEPGNEHGSRTTMLFLTLWLIKENPFT